MPGGPRDHPDRYGYCAYLAGGHSRIEWASLHLWLNAEVWTLVKSTITTVDPPPRLPIGRAPAASTAAASSWEPAPPPYPPPSSVIDAPLSATDKAAAGAVDRGKKRERWASFEPNIEVWEDSCTCFFYEYMDIVY